MALRQEDEIAIRGCECNCHSKPLTAAERKVRAEIAVATLQAIQEHIEFNDMTGGRKFTREEMNAR